MLKQDRYRNQGKITFSRLQYKLFYSGYKGPSPTKFSYSEIVGSGDHLFFIFYSLFYFKISPHHPAPLAAEDCLVLPLIYCLSNAQLAHVHVVVVGERMLKYVPYRISGSSCAKLSITYQRIVSSFQYCIGGRQEAGRGQGAVLQPHTLHKK